MREYRVGERVVMGNYLGEVLEVGPKRVRLSAIGPVATSWWQAEQVIRMESEAVGRLVQEIPQLVSDGKGLGLLSFRYLLDKTIVRFEPVLGERLDTDGDNVGHALWLLKEKMEGRG